jgi:hypothetical protein
MKILLWIVGGLMAIFAVAYVAGFLIAEDQTHTRTLTLKQTPAAVHAVLADVQNMPKWHTGVEKVELLPLIDGKEATRQTFKGNMQMTIITAENHPPGHLVRTMGDADGPFVGSWTYAITPTNGGSDVALTEQSKVRNPVTRLMMKFYGLTKYMDDHLRDLAAHSGKQQPFVRRGAPSAANRESGAAHGAWFLRQ